MAEPPFGDYDMTFLLGYAFSAAIDELHRRLESRGFADVRPVHGYLFQRIASNGATGNEIAEHLSVTKQAASQMVDYLEQHHYVTRKPHPLDGRGKIVLLTDRGWNCIRETEEILADVQRRWVEAVGTERFGMLHEDLKKLVFAAGNGATPLRFRPVW
jgi:DNA-binding MarR family transcriptional regulator